MAVEDTAVDLAAAVEVVAMEAADMAVAVEVSDTPEYCQTLIPILKFLGTEADT